MLEWLMFDADLWDSDCLLRGNYFRVHHWMYVSAHLNSFQRPAISRKIFHGVEQDVIKQQRVFLLSRAEGYF